MSKLKEADMRNLERDKMSLMQELSTVRSRLYVSK